MAVISFTDADNFEVDKAYFNKLKSKEEITYLILENYRNQPLNDTVKGVIVEGDVSEESMVQGILYFKVVNYESSDETDLESFVDNIVNPTDIYTYVINLPKTYNDMRVLTNLVTKYTDVKVRFIGGNLLDLNGAGVGFFPKGFIQANRLKTKSVSRFEFSRVKLIDFDKLTVRGIEEYHARKTQVTKSKVNKRKGSKPVRKKRSVMDILSSY